MSLWVVHMWLVEEVFIEHFILCSCTSKNHTFYSTWVGNMNATRIFFRLSLSKCVCVYYAFTPHMSNIPIFAPPKYIFRHNSIILMVILEVTPTSTTKASSQPLLYKMDFSLHFYFDGWVDEMCFAHVKQKWRQRKSQGKNALAAIEESNQMCLCVGEFCVESHLAHQKNVSRCRFAGIETFCDVNKRYILMWIYFIKMLDIWIAAWFYLEMCWFRGIVVSFVLRFGVLCFVVLYVFHPLAEWNS